jgi:hypothetical protein
VPPDSEARAAQPADISPLFKADPVNLALSASKDGKLRVVYAGWEDAKAVLPTRCSSWRWGSQGVEARLLPRRNRPLSDPPGTPSASCKFSP